MSPRTTRVNKSAISIFFMFALVANMFVFAPPAKACWGCAFGAEIMGQAMTTIRTQLMGALLGTLKVTANAVLSSQVGQMIGGTTTADALFVTDWNQFLYQQPQAQVQVYMNDFFTTVTRGKASSLNYVGDANDAGNPAGSYVAHQLRVMENAIADEAGANTVDDMGMFYNLDEYTPSPEIMFRDGSFRSFNAFVSNPMNNPFGAAIVSSAVYTKKMNQVTDVARTEAQSSGFIGKKDKGKTIAPAATVEAMLSDVQNVGNTMIAAATNPGEFLTGVVSAVVNKAVTGIIQKGVGKIQASIQKEVKQLDKKATATLDKVNKELGPGAKFTKEWSQKTDVYAKPYTKPPPTARDDGVYCGGAC